MDSDFEKYLRANGKDPRQQRPMKETLGLPLMYILETKADSYEEQIPKYLLGYLDSTRSVAAVLAAISLFRQARKPDLERKSTELLSAVLAKQDCVRCFFHELLTGRVASQAMAEQAARIVAQPLGPTFSFLVDPDPARAQDVHRRAVGSQLVLALTANGPSAEGIYHAAALAIRDFAARDALFWGTSVRPFHAALLALGSASAGRFVFPPVAETRLSAFVLLRICDADVAAVGTPEQRALLLPPLGAALTAAGAGGPVEEARPPHVEEFLTVSKRLLRTLAWAAPAPADALFALAVQLLQAPLLRAHALSFAPDFATFAARPWSAPAERDAAVAHVLQVCCAAVRDRLDMFDFLSRLVFVCTHTPRSDVQGAARLLIDALSEGGSAAPAAGADESARSERDALLLSRACLSAAHEQLKAATDAVEVDSARVTFLSALRATRQLLEAVEDMSAPEFFLVLQLVGRVSCDFSVPEAAREAALAAATAALAASRTAPAEAPPTPDRPAGARSAELIVGELTDARITGGERSRRISELARAPAAEAGAAFEAFVLFLRDVSSGLESLAVAGESARATGFALGFDEASVAAMGPLATAALARLVAAHPELLVPRLAALLRMLPEEHLALLCESVCLAAALLGEEGRLLAPQLVAALVATARQARAPFLRASVFAALAELFSLAPGRVRASLAQEAVAAAVLAVAHAREAPVAKAGRHAAAARAAASLVFVLAGNPAIGQETKTAASAVLSHALRSAAFARDPLTRRYFETALESIDKAAFVERSLDKFSSVQRLHNPLEDGLILPDGRTLPPAPLVEPEEPSDERPAPDDSSKNRRAE